KNGVLSAKIDNDRSVGVRLYRDDCRTSLWIAFAHFSYQLIQAQPLGFRAACNPASIPLRILGDLGLVHKHHTGERHDEYHQAAGNAGEEMSPKDNLAQSHSHTSANRRSKL